jgi:hypothetical protein
MLIKCTNTTFMAGRGTSHVNPLRQRGTSIPTSRDVESLADALGLYLLTCLVFCGCGSGGGSGGLPLQPVSGVVKWNGQPLGGADIVFKLKDGNRSSFGRTDANGRYELTTRASNDGAPAGDYLVAITKIDLAAGDASKFIPQDDPRYNPYVGKSGAGGPPPKSSFPGHYGDTATSGLTARVSTGKNTLDFNLK